MFPNWTMDIKEANRQGKRSMSQDIFKCFALEHNASKAKLLSLKAGFY